FQAALEDFNRDSSLRVGIVTGKGPVFCSGMDIGDLPYSPGPEPAVPSLMRGLETFKPLIAAIRGPALGGGLELALACDIRIAAENATFGFPEVKLGIIPGWGGTQRAIRQLAWSSAAALLLTGQIINAAEALRIGLINQVVASSELDNCVFQWAEMLCQAAPLAVQAAKEAMLKGSQLSFPEGLQLEDALCQYLKTTLDYQEGLQAYRENRPPAFKGQ
ncbi:MAG TPA: enoyl-CoA hydratase-related protein, partial [Dehalococcoidales bacterium]|nr:enoyl-CoA hydratase-related protein [Dehalococcoidales bacterium]